MILNILTLNLASPSPVLHGRIRVSGPATGNIALTPPYFHTGKVWDLKQVVQVMGTSQLGAELTDEKAESVVMFLKTLTGKQPKIEYPILPPSIPETPLPDIDAMQPSRIAHECASHDAERI